MSRTPTRGTPVGVPKMLGDRVEPTEKGKNTTQFAAVPVFVFFVQTKVRERTMK